jgi:hypothetical protein
VKLSHCLLCSARRPRQMTKHSKNNTASPIFSYAEYKKTEYGTKSVRPHAPLTGLDLIFSSHSNVWAMSPCDALMHVLYAYSVHGNL